MLTAAIITTTPSIFSTSIGSGESLSKEVLELSRGSAIVLLAAFICFVVYQTATHDGLFEEALEFDEKSNTNASREFWRPKLTMIEALVGMVIALGFVSALAYFLVCISTPMFISFFHLFWTWVVS